MNRRRFITLLGGAATWPLAARAQPATPVIGFLSGGSSRPFAAYLDAFHRGAAETGFAEGRNLAVEYRWAEGQNARLHTLADDLVRLPVALIVATGGNAAALAAKAATSVIPIVFGAGSDPVGLGLVASLNRPHGNATGVNFFTTELEPKRLGLLRELIPNTALMVVLLNPTNTFPRDNRRMSRRQPARSGCSWNLARQLGTGPRQRICDHGSNPARSSAGRQRPILLQPS